MVFLEYEGNTLEKPFNSRQRFRPSSPAISMVTYK